MEVYAIGIDIGGTNTKYGLVRRNGTLVRQGWLKTKIHPTPEAFVAALTGVLKPFIGDENVVGIGVGAPNANFYTGEIVDAANLPWKGVVPLAKLLSETLSLPVALTNDANAAALGEGAYGAAQGLSDYIVVTLGTGLGSGFVANSQLIYGADGCAGELGHVIAVRDGRSCGCGRQGCLETYASATGIVRTAEDWLRVRREPSALHEISEKLTAWDIHQAADRGDALALEIFEFTGRILGQTLADAVAITSPQAVVFFGGLARAGELLLRPVRQHFEENLLHVYRNKIKLLQSGLPDSDAAILGASALVWNLPA